MILASNTLERTSDEYFSGITDFQKKPKEKTLQGHKIYHLVDYYSHGATPDKPFVSLANKYIKNMKGERSRCLAVEFFRKMFLKLDLGGWFWTFVPSSDPRKADTGTRAIATKLNDSLCDWQVRAIERKTKIITSTRNSAGFISEKLITTIAQHKETLRLTGLNKNSRRKIVLIDDVVTSGSSIIACKQLLLENEAKDVMMIGLGYTLR